MLIASNSFGQIITGLVSSKLVPLNGAIIRNLTINKIAVSDVKGNFEILTHKGDTLITSFVSYETDTLVIKSQTFLYISLKPTMQTLSDVVIRGKRLSPLEQFKRNQEDFKQIYRIGNNSRFLSANGSYGQMGIGLSIDALYSTFSKEGKNARHLQRVLLNDYYSSVVDSRFTKTLVSRITGYQGKPLEDFILTNKPSYQFIQTATDYDIVEYIKRRANGIVLQADDPVAKSGGSGIKFKFKMPNTQPSTRPIGTDYTPKIRP